ncbi:hypothetical protein ASC76_10305 [Rhizobacter sp. Root404]|nr:hypothetical protein ASC76_10305 [Rhizobacter sp. Root404]
MYEDSYANDIAFTQSQLVNYFLSISNVIAQTGDEIGVHEARSWLVAQTAPFFEKQPSIKICHRSPIMVAKKGSVGSVFAASCAD